MAGRTATNPGVICRTAWAGLLLTLGMWVPLEAQVALRLDSEQIPLPPELFGRSTFSWPLRYSSQTEYSLTAGFYSYLHDAQYGDQQQLLLQHWLKTGWTVGKPGRVVLTNSFTHRLGIICYFDSLTRFCQDENSLKTRAEVTLYKNGNAAVDSEISTRFFNAYEYRQDDSGRTVRVLAASFLTPLVWNLSAGLTWNLPGTGSLLFGLTGVRLTYLRDTSLFSSQETEQFFGVERGRNFKAEYGFSCRIQTDRTFGKILRWNCDLLLFRAGGKPADLSLKNLFEIRAFRFLVISLQTNVMYDEDISSRWQLRNILSAGISLKK